MNTADGKSQIHEAFTREAKVVEAKAEWRPMFVTTTFALSEASARLRGD